MTSTLTLLKVQARKSALPLLLDTFFDNSAESAMAVLLDVKSKEITDGALARLQQLTDQARQNASPGKQRR